MGRLVNAVFLLLLTLVTSCGGAETLDNKEFGVSTSALTFSNGLTTPIASMSSWTNGNFGTCGSAYYFSGLCHTGNDIAAAAGTQVRAIAAGTLLAISGQQKPEENCPSGWGYDYGVMNTCNVAYAVLHYNAAGQPFVSVYGHMRYDPNVPVGTRFTAGSVIGAIGRYRNTSGTQIGGSNNPDHLHWGIKPGSGAPTDWGRTACSASQSSGYATFPSGCTSSGFVAPGSYMLANFPQSLPYSYSPNAYMCPGPVTGGANTNWVYSCGTPRVTYTQGETAYGMIHINDIQPNTQFRFKISALNNNSPSWDWTANWNNTGSSGWGSSYFWPAMENAQPGNWTFRFWVDTGAGFKLMDTQYFAVLPSNNPSYEYTAGFVTCRGPVSGGANTNWVYTCQNPASSFSIGDSLIALIRIDDITENFRWKTEVYANGTYMWSDTTGWNDVGQWGWDKAYHWPTVSNVWISGLWEYRIFVDAGSGFQQIDTATFYVN